MPRQDDLKRCQACEGEEVTHRRHADIGEYENVGATPGPTAMGMLDLSNPDLDWVRLATGMGVEAARATTLEQCADLMRQSFRQNGPFLIELMI